MKRDIFLDFFPPPKYLAPSAIGFDISDNSIKYVELQRKRGVFSVRRFGIRIIPKGIIESGVIKEKDKLVKLFNALQKELKTKNIIVSLPEEKAFLSEFKLPAMKKEEMRNAIELQLQEHIPLSPEDTIFDFEIEKNKQARHLNINLTAFPKQLIETYSETLREAGFNPTVFEMEARAFARAVVPEHTPGAHFIVDFGKTRTTFAVVSEGNIKFSSTINAASDQLDIALSKNLNIDKFQAEKIKKKHGLIKSKGNEEIFNSLILVISVIKDEISRRITYWNSRQDKQNKKEPIVKILLCGGASNLTGLPSYLSHELGLPTELVNPWVNMTSFDDYIPEITAKDSLIYATAIGLAMRSII